MMKKLTFMAVLFPMVFSGVTPAGADGDVSIEKREWSWQGPFGHFDRASAQRGLQVYREICAACHGLGYFHYRDLAGLGYSPDEIKTIAALDEVQDGPDETGDFFTRPAKPSDRHAKPFENKQAARAANGGALPTDLLTTIRASGPDAVYAILNGYEEAPAGFALAAGQYYNKAVAGHKIAMPPPLEDGIVDYQDGSEATLSRQAEDVVTFLAWAGEPTLEERKKTGFKVMLFLFAFLVIVILTKRRVWASQHKP